MTQDTDEWLFVDDEEDAGGTGAADAPGGGETWPVLIVDDDADVHIATQYALGGLLIENRALEFLHAYSAAEARALLQVHPRIAVILLDVVMEHETAGLDLARQIRSELGLSEVRIILRTGQPGYAPELDVIRDYDINDYKTKAELTRTRLFTVVTTAIRSYRQIHAINASRQGLNLIVNSSGDLLKLTGCRNFAAGVIQQMAALLGLPPEGLVCAHEVRSAEGALLDVTIIAASGKYSPLIDQPLSRLEAGDIREVLLATLAERRNIHGDRHLSLFFPGQKDCGLAAYLDTHKPLDEVDEALLAVFCHNIRILFDNIQLVARLREQAYTDPLLGLPNRTGFLQAVESALTATTPATDPSIMLIDLDRFAEFNHAFGHALGDGLLHSATERLRTLPQTESLARVAADTFALLVTGNTPSPEQVLQVFAAPLNVAERPHAVTVSLGLARVTGATTEAAEAFKNANIALKSAKLARRGSFCHFSPHMESEIRQRVELLEELRFAFGAEHLFLAYQPQIRLADGATIGVEALLRWSTPDGRNMAPAQFIPLAEKSGLIIPLGEWVLRSACQQLRRLCDCGQALRMAVNLSVAQLRQADFLALLDRTIAETGIDPTLLELELTESMAMLDTGFVVETIDAIRQRNISVAIDDFGTGFSSLSYLDRLRVNRLKIDRSFVSLLEFEQGAARIADLIVQLGNRFGFAVIAEGVETPAQAEKLLALGCDEAQGFLYAQALPVNELEDWLGARP